MKYITIEELIFIHHRIIIELQPEVTDFIVRNIGGLYSSVAKPQQSAGGIDAYDSAFKKTAALTQSIISNHPFFDGNKRVGITAGVVFLMNNGYLINASNTDIYLVAMGVSEGRISFNELAEWFENHFNQ
jgi:death-on-curing protein